MNESTNRLYELYMQSSKHSNYQILAESVQGLLDTSKLEITSRNEKERLRYILRHVNFLDTTVMDIGGNTGYFTFEVLDRGAKHVYYCEGNRNHAEFVKEAVKLLKCEKDITIDNSYYEFGEIQDKPFYDITFCLNVIHHLGDDFGKTNDKLSALDEMKRCINSMASVTDTLVFQMGYNWKGDRKQCLFENGTKAEMIDFIRKSTEGVWQIQNIGVAVVRDDRVDYEDINEENIKRIDSYGEFLNRPIFIMKSCNH